MGVVEGSVARDEGAWSGLGRSRSCVAQLRSRLYAWGLPMVRSVCLHKEWVSSTTRPKLSRVGGVGSEVGGVGAGVGSSGCGVGGT